MPQLQMAQSVTRQLGNPWGNLPLLPSTAFSPSRGLQDGQALDRGRSWNVIKPLFCVLICGENGVSWVGGTEQELGKLPPGALTTHIFVIVCLLCFWSSCLLVRLGSS